MEVMKQRLYKVNITKDEEEGFFVAEVPTLSPCITYGETLEEAIEMIKEAIEAVVESRLENGYPVPDDNFELEHQTTVQAVLQIKQTPFQFVTA
jgi:antitoxin HicB